MAESDQKEETNESDGTNEALVWIGIGALTVAAVATTIYLVKKDRTNELNAMKYSVPKSESRIRNMLVGAREGFSSFWDSTTETFDNVNKFVQRVLSKEDTVPLFPEVVDPIDNGNDSEVSGTEEIV